MSITRPDDFSTINLPHNLNKPSYELEPISPEAQSVVNEIQTHYRTKVIPALRTAVHLSISNGCDPVKLQKYLTCALDSAVNYPGGFPSEDDINNMIVPSLDTKDGA